MDKTIFRAYDIRGIYPSQVDEQFAYNLGRAFGSIIKQRNQTFTLVGYDNRQSSPTICLHTIKGITDTGIDVINIGLCTTPIYYFGWHFFKAKSGIMITASHNPKEYNGFKFSFNGIHNCFGDDVLFLRDFIEKNKFAAGRGKITNKNIKKEYINFLLNDLQFGPKKIKAVFDAGNGSTTAIIKNVLAKIKINYIPLFFENDSNFPNHHPDPSIHKNLESLINTVKKEQADIGFAYDGDGDRLGLIDEKGNIVETDKIMIIVIRDIIDKLADKRILYDVKCSKSLEDEIKKLKGIPILSRTGNSYLRAAIANENILFGGEYSGHIFFNDRFPGYDDGIYASLRLIEILTNTNKTCSELLDNINHYYSTPELKIKAEDSKKFKVIDQIVTHAITKKENVITIDGAKIIYDDGFALIRASNTGPNITMRFEALTKERLDEIKAYWYTLTENLIKETT